MCDYSLQSVASRSARVGDKLVSTMFAGTFTRGFAAVGCANVAVCLLPGTEIAFENNAEKRPVFRFFGKPKLRQKVARFCKVNSDRDCVHHDALEFPNGRVVLLTDLVEGQHVTVLQLPVSAHALANTMLDERQAVAPT